MRGIKSYTWLTNSVIILGIMFLLNGCSEDSVQPEPPAPVEEVFVIGTQVESDFRMTGQFGISVLPVDESGGAILSNELNVDIVISEPEDILATSEINGVNTPSDLPLAAALSLDGSGSMLTNDPMRTRVAGAQLFIDVLEASGLQYEAAAFAYIGTPDFTNFFYSQLLQNFTDDADSLRSAIELVRASGGTPTYESLLEILRFIDSERPLSGFERVIVLLSDGQPNSTALRDSVCNLASFLEIPIYTIGLGPASDIGLNNAIAVENMRFIANCTQAAYAGISSTDSSSVLQIYANIARATSQGSASLNVQLSGDGFLNLTTGTIVSGEITIGNESGQASENFSFRVP